MMINGCTLYGSENKTGIGVSLAAGSHAASIENSIIYGFVTGISHGTANQNGNIENANTFYNNTTDRTNYMTGDDSIAIAPSFTSVTQVTGATATVSGFVLTQAGATFVTAGVTAGRDVCTILSGTTSVVGSYTINAVTETTLTFDIAPGNSAVADKVFQITVGNNFAIGTALEDLGTPGIFPGGFTTGYRDIGAVQRRADYPATTDVRNGTTFNNGASVGSLASGGGGGGGSGSRHLGPARF